MMTKKDAPEIQRPVESDDEKQERRERIKEVESTDSLRVNRLV